MTFNIGDKVKNHITDSEGVVIATDGTVGPFSKIKIKWNFLLSPTSWEYSDMMRHVVNN